MSSISTSLLRTSRCCCVLGVRGVVLEKSLAECFVMPWMIFDVATAAAMHIADDGGWCSLHIHCIFAGQAFDYIAGRIPYECVVCVCEYGSATAV